MKTLTTLVLGMAIGALSMAAVAAVPVGPADDATKKAVQEVKRGIVAGHKAKDRAALDRLYADDYTAIDAKGVMRTKADLLKALPTDAEIACPALSAGSMRREEDSACSPLQQRSACLPSATRAIRSRPFST